MKKFFVLAVAMLMAGSVFAATTVKKSIVATAAFEGEATFTFVLKNIATGAVSETLNWTSADAFNMGSTTTWVRADEYAVVAATVTKAGYAVYMNTDNKAANPSLEPNNAGSYGGLVNQGQDGGEYRGYVPVLFSYVPQEDDSITFNGSDVVTAERSDRYLSDVSTQGDNPYSKNYTTIAALNGPTFFTKTTTGADVQYPSNLVQNNTAYMYFFGGFKDIIGGDTYTTTINVIEEVE